MRTHHYPSDVTDAQWALIEPHIPPEPGGGRPRKTDMRDVLDAILYILRTGCQWRYLPGDFPPKSTVWRYFDQWRRDGTLDTIHDRLRRKVRTAEKPYHPRTSASVDSQSVDTTSGGEQRGRDNAKNVDGRKRHIVVDSMGLLLAVLVTAASVDDAAAAPALFARLDGQPMGKVVRMYADSKYHNFKLYEWVEENAAWDLSIVRRPEGVRGLGEAADPVDGRADVRLAGPLPPPEQGPGEERPVVGVVHQAGDDPVDAPPAPALRCGRRVPLPQCSLNRPYGTVSKSEYEVRLHDNTVRDNGGSEIAIAAARARLDARRNFWGTPSGVAVGRVVVLDEAQRSRARCFGAARTASEAVEISVVCEVGILEVGRTRSMNPSPGISPVNLTRLVTARS